MKAMYMNKKISIILLLFVSAFTKTNELHKTINIGGFTINIKRENIIKNDTEVIVNPANSRLTRGGGLCGQIFFQSQEKGKLLVEECKRKTANKNEIAITDVVETDAFGLKNFKKIYHVVSPNFNAQNRIQKSIPFDKEGRELLTKCYENILKRAIDSGVKSISIPFLGAGNFRKSFCDLPDMAIMAIESIKNFCKSNKSANLTIDFVCFDPLIYQLVTHPVCSKIKLKKLKQHMKKMVPIFYDIYENIGEYEMILIAENCLKNVLR